MPSDSSFLPIVVRFQNKACTIIGGGRIAFKRVHTLLAAGAIVTVVSPTLCDDLSLLSTNGQILWNQAEFDPATVGHPFLLIAATNSSVVNIQVVEYAYSNGILVNDCSEGLAGDVVFPATVRRGELIMSVTTLGASPSLAAEIASKLSNMFGSEYEEYVTLLSEMRQIIFEHTMEPDLRVSTNRELLHNQKVFDLVKLGKFEEARKEAHNCILSVLG